MLYTNKEYGNDFRRGWTSRLPLRGNPKVSMVIAAYNRPHQILSCIHSLIVQTHQNLEILVVHDGPGCEVRKAIIAIGNNKIQYHETDRRYGPELYGHNSREYGTALATGDWIGHSNDDNYYAPVYFEWMIADLLVQNAQFAYCNMINSQTQWMPFYTSPEPCAIDAGGWICSAEVVKKTPWPNKDLGYSDGLYARELAKQCRVVKIPGFLFMHN